MEKLEDRRVLASWSGTLAVDTTWTNSEVQEVTGDLTIPQGVTLTIDPGTIVKFASSLVDLRVNGTLSAAGALGEEVIFTSIHDDVGGDTNGNGNATAPAAGQWSRIRIESTGTANIDRANIRYGASGELLVNGGDLTLTNSTVGDSNGDGVRVENADLTLTDNIYQNHARAAISTDVNSNPTISGVTVSNNVINGLRLDPGTSTKNLN